MTSVLRGRCLCGSVAFRLVGALSPAAQCHCAMCRRWHGHIGVYTDVARSGLVIDEAKGLAWYRSSDIARRGFCRECGASLFWDGDGRDTISIAVGALEAPTGLATTLAIYTKDKGDYYALDPGVPVRPDVRDRDQGSAGTKG